MGNFFKDIAKPFKKASKWVGERTGTKKYFYDPLTKMGVLDPLGLMQGKEKRGQRAKKAAKIGGSALTALITSGGNPIAAIAAGGRQGLRQSKKGKGNEPLTWKTMADPLASGATIGSATSLGKWGLSKLGSASNSPSLNLYEPGKALERSLGGKLPWEGYTPKVMDFTPAAPSNWQRFMDLADKANDMSDMAGDSGGGSRRSESSSTPGIQPYESRYRSTLPLRQYSPQEALYDPAEQMKQIQDIMDQFTKKKERYFYA